MINLNQNKFLHLFNNLSQVAANHNLKIYVVGGYVRDLLMGSEKEIQDIDFVTDGDGIALAKAFAKELNPKLKVSVFKNFGTAMFKYHDVELEFVSARKESYSPESRNPLVEMGSIKDDQERRDFTINAMAISLNSEDFGSLIDPFGGQKDLENKILKTPLDPKQTYSDDPLRMMRALRFAAVLGFEIEEKSLKAISSEAHRISIISKERIMTEFNKIMLSQQASKSLALMEKTGLMKLILPELSALKGVEDQDGQSHKDNFYHTLEVLDNISLKTQNLWLRWAALLHDIGKAPTKKFIEGIGWTFHGHEFLGSKMIKNIFYRLKLPMGNDLKYVQKIVRLSSRPIALITDDTSDSALRRMLFDAGNDIEDLFTLCKADITTKNTFKQEKYIKNFSYVEEKLKKLEERDHIRNFQPPISGEEIMSIFNLQPGREIGVLKEKVKEAILEGELQNDAQEAKKFVIEWGKNMGLVVSTEK